MQDNNVGIKSNQTIEDRCSICKQIITENDLVYIHDEDNANLPVHFRCYVELQEKICSECGLPFTDQESLYYCVEHREYFHSNVLCMRKHVDKHLRFKTAIYDASKNRVTLQDTREQDEDL